MWNHGPAMVKAMEQAGVNVPRFEDNELANILAYLYVLRSAEAVGDPARGEKVFTSKSCSQCHGEKGPGPDLAESEALKSPAHLASAMWNHAPQMEQAAKERNIDWPSLSGSEIRDLLAFFLAKETGQSHTSQRR